MGFVKPQGSYMALPTSQRLDWIISLTSGPQARAQVRTFNNSDSEVL